MLRVGDRAGEGCFIGSLVAVSLRLVIFCGCVLKMGVGIWYDGRMVGTRKGSKRERGWEESVGDRVMRNRKGERVRAKEERKEEGKGKRKRKKKKPLDTISFEL